MTLRAFSALAFLPLVAGCAGGASDTTELYAMRVRSGERAYVGGYRTLAPTVEGCPTVGLPDLTAIAAPRHGRMQFDIGRERNAPAHPACGGVRKRTMAVFYTSIPGYRGPDSLAYRVRFGNGETRAIYKNISVR